MPIAPKELFYQKIVEELHVSGCESYGRINARVKSAASFQLCKIWAETPSQILGKPLEHLAEVAILEFQDIYVHQ